MASPFQAAILLDSPCSPNAVAWSEENLVAVASGHIVTIVNPASVNGPRGLIKIKPSPPFQVGLVKGGDLLTPCLMPIYLSRETRPFVRSISWSHAGLAPNAGCLLAICTSEGRVKLYRPPFCEFSAEWIEVADVTDLLCDHFASAGFRDLDTSLAPSLRVIDEDNCRENRDANYSQDSIASKRPKRTSKKNIGYKGARGKLSCGANGDLSNEGVSDGHNNGNEKSFFAFPETTTIPFSSFEQGLSVEVLKMDGAQRIWIRGTIECIDDAKAFVKFPEEMDGERHAWIEMKTSGKIDASICKGVEAENGLSPCMRPFMDLGNFPSEILSVDPRRMSEILSVGQAVEAWLNYRWVEGFYVGSNGHGFLVKLSGGNNCITIDPTTVRLAPLWNGDLRKWQATCVKIQVKNQDMSDAADVHSKDPTMNNLHSKILVLNSEEKIWNNGPQLITASQFASRSALLSSLVVSWSPVLPSLSESIISPSGSNKCAVLAVGGKSGKISFWRVPEPQVYKIENVEPSVGMLLVGLLQAHDSWITATSWGSHAVTSSSQLILATSSSNGSVKIWQVDAGVLVNSSWVNGASFSLLKEVIMGSVPVSALSLAVPVNSVDKVLLAIGKGSGALEVWICCTSSSELQCAGSYDGHDQVVTGLAWAFDGCCLYSCGQDNSIRSWILHGTAIHEVPFSPNSPKDKGYYDHLEVSDSCFGMAVSPGNLVVAVARSFDTELLDQMYQARCQKAAIEFFWTGGLHQGFHSPEHQESRMVSYAGLSDSDLMCWESNILWSLKSYDHSGRPLVLWDVIMALLALKQSASKSAEVILFKWLSTLFLSCHLDLSPEKILLQAPSSLSKIDSRHLHLLNIICRCVMLAEANVDINDRENRRLYELTGDEHDPLKLWTALLIFSERELRERLVAFTFSTVIARTSCSGTALSGGANWTPSGVHQMGQWLNRNHDVKHQLKCLSSDIRKLDKRLASICEDVMEERCSFCSASLPFESPEVAFCRGVECSRSSGQCHKQARCSVSMRVCPATPLWFCICCRRWASRLMPQKFFTLSNCSLDTISQNEFSALHEYPKPLCPFCGILLQRLRPDFLLSASPT